MELTGINNDKAIAKVDKSLCSAIAKETGFIVRERKFNPYDFLLALGKLVTEKSPTFRDIAILLSNMVEGDEIISKQAVADKFNATTIVFLKRVLNSILSKVSNTLNVCKELGKKFHRILVEDSTINRLPDALHDAISGIGSINKSISSIRIQATVDLLSESFVSFETSPSTSNDQKASPNILDLIKEGDLSIRDRGYLNFKVLKQIAEQNAFFISRISPNTVFYNPENKKEKINLLDVLSKNQATDIPILLGNIKLPVRLVAIPVSEEISNKRKRVMKSGSKNNPSKDNLKLLEWSIFITNIPTEMLDYKAIMELYGLRWRIEIIFKAWKSHLSFTKFHEQITPIQVECYIYARLIWITAQFEGFIQPAVDYFYSEHNKNISLLKIISYSNQIYSCILYKKMEKGLLNRIKQEKIMVTLCSYDKRIDNRIDYLTKLANIVRKNEKELLMNIQYIA
jgi:hypothetical protein